MASKFGSFILSTKRHLEYKTVKKWTKIEHYLLKDILLFSDVFEFNSVWLADLASSAILLYKFRLVWSHPFYSVKSHEVSDLCLANVNPIKIAISITYSTPFLIEGNNATTLLYV